MLILSYENEFNLHVNENSFSYERMSTKTRFEKEAEGNSEMAYYRPFLSSFRHIPPSGGFYQVNCLDQQWPPTGKLFICSNLGQNPSAMGAGHLQR